LRASQDPWSTPTDKQRQLNRINNVSLFHCENQNEVTNRKSDS
jgi:hypothetical protein